MRVNVDRPTMRTIHKYCNVTASNPFFFHEPISAIATIPGARMRQSILVVVDHGARFAGNVRPRRLPRR